MSRVRAHTIAVSLDGYATGEGQSLEAPFGHAGMRLMEWAFPTATFQALSGHRERVEVDPASAPDDVFAARSWENIGAEIMGANKFGPPGWQGDADWTGWWGEEPPFRTPTFVLTHQPRESIEMKGGTTFHFRNASIEDVLAEAREAADGQDVRLGGGPSSLRDYLAAGLVDHLHVAVVPIVLGRGVRLWDGLEALEDGYDVESATTPSGITHITFDRTRAS
ncbi:dihydrofolate reductase family protein [Nocardioides albus]|uniref:Dihydrofolate reductase n=1 Tax=Nocardioides albus TaxID=1841 RepID=A0A7W5FA15_9ACTN|nr:dihydrofolate reductase family protein [Nocardioides albus]MBB3090656.1 dihydrofolate reductase [Nocardioides albus]GGU25513.1 deaminase reductase [Nocardioides albus]